MGSNDTDAVVAFNTEMNKLSFNGNSCSTDGSNLFSTEGTKPIMTFTFPRRSSAPNTVSDTSQSIANSMVCAVGTTSISSSVLPVVLTATNSTMPPMPPGAVMTPLTPASVKEVVKNTLGPQVRVKFSGQFNTTDAATGQQLSTSGK
jgi:hypothetical protein